MRNNLLEMAWTGAPLTIGGRELVLTWGRFSLLQAWGNPLFVPEPDPGEPEEERDYRNDIGPPEAMGEVLLSCYATKDELRALRAMTTAQRGTSVLDFLLEFEEEIGDAASGIQKRMQSIEAASVEIDDMGKHKAGEGSCHAD